MRDCSSFHYSSVGLYNICQTSQIRHKGFYIYFSHSALDETTNYIYTYLHFFPFPSVCCISYFAWKKCKVQSPHRREHTRPRSAWNASVTSSCPTFGDTGGSGVWADQSEWMRYSGSQTVLLYDKTDNFVSIQACKPNLVVTWITIMKSVYVCKRV